MQGLLARTGSNPQSMFWLALLAVVLGAAFLSSPDTGTGRKRRRRKPRPSRPIP